MKKKIDNLPQSRITAQMEGHFGWDSPETGILQYFAKSFFGGGGAGGKSNARGSLVFVSLELGLPFTLTEGY